MLDQLPLPDHPPTSTSQPSPSAQRARISRKHLQFLETKRVKFMTEEPPQAPEINTGRQYAKTILKQPGSKGPTKQLRQLNHMMDDITKKEKESRAFFEQFNTKPSLPSKRQFSQVRSPEPVDLPALIS